MSEWYTFESFIEANWGEGEDRSLCPWWGFGALALIEYEYTDWGMSRGTGVHACWEVRYAII